MDPLEAAGRAATERPDDAEAWIGMAEALVDIGALAPAKLVAARARACEPEDAAQWARLGRVLKAVGDPAEALQALRAASALAPADVETVRDLAELALSQGRSAEAVEAIDRALSHREAPELVALRDRVEHGPDPSQASGPSLTGDLAVFRLPEILEFLGMQRATGLIQVSSNGREAVVRLAEGRICDVSAPGHHEGPREQRVIVGIRQLLLWEDGSVHFQPQEPLDAVESPETGFEHQGILMQVMKAIDEDQR
jgi:tetratricopeptide (TPR) repeat protein